ncbi:MAG: recombinase family protein [Chloroflexi bacterium]|nr:recombinase family protein [Chloroflexota bacterium]
MNRAGLYERVSTDAQVEKYGLGAQDWGLKKRAKEKGYHLIPDGEKDAFVDDGYSGGDLDRPALIRLRRAIAEGLIDLVLCYDPDRLSRSLSDLLLLGDQWEKAGVRLEFITQDTDASPEGRMFFAMRGAVAEYERAKIRERTIRGRLEKARQGKVVSGAAAPYGYRFDPASSTLVINQEEAKIVRLIFHLYSEERLSMVGLADRLNRLCVARPRGGKRWRSSSLARMLSNETYLGVLWQNRWQVGKAAARTGQKLVKARQRSREEQIAATVPAIVTRDIFDVVQKRLDQNLLLARRNTKREYLLTGLIKHTCGASMGGRTCHGWLYYRCLNSHAFRAPINEKGEPQPCSCKWVNGHNLEAAVWNTVTDLLKNPDLLTKELESLTQSGSATRETLEMELNQLHKRLEEFPNEERRLVEGYRKGFYADFMMREEVARIHKEKSAADQRFRELELQLKHLDKALSYKDQLEQLTARLSLGLENMSFSERQELLRMLVDGIVYDDGRLTIKTIIPLDKQQLHPACRGLR